MLRELFTKNLDAVFMVYGLSFVVIGIAVLVQPRRESIFKLSGIIWLLGAFGLIHGLNEWLDMFSIIKGGDSKIWDILRITALTSSYVCLFEFGRRLVFLRLHKFLNKWVTLALSLCVVGLIFLSNEERSVWPRYLLGFPGGLLSASGFIFYYEDNKSILYLARMRRYFLAAAASIGIYGILGGIIVPKTSFFPASVINNASFLNLFGIPVQIFRAGCACCLSWAVWNILSIFNWEIMSSLESSLQEVTAARTYVNNILKSMINALIVVNTDAQIIAVNEATCEILGYKKEELVGKPARELFEGENPFETAEFKKLMETGYFKNYELTCISKSKTKIPLLFSASVMSDPKGQITGILTVGKDIRDSKSLQEKLVRAEKLSVMGRVAGIIGHEVKNQLSIIRNSVYFIKMRLQNEDEKIKKHLNILDEATEETNSIIENILSFSRTKQPEFKKENLKNILLAAINKVEAPPGITVNTRIDDELPKIQADKLQLTQVFVNIIINAIQAMEKGGKLTIKAVREDNHIVLLFEDTGPGISAEDKKMLFELFFSTKTGGMGLGLATSKIIIEAHRGSIDIESETGKGTTVKVLLPID